MAGSSEQLWSEIGHLREAVDQNTDAVRAVSVAINKLAVIEERQSEMKASVSRIGEVVDRIDGRVRVVETELPTLQLAKKVVLLGVIGVLGMVGTAVVTLVLLH